MSPHMLFFLATRLELPPEALRRLGGRKRMRTIGAGINPDDLINPPIDTSDT